MVRDLILEAVEQRFDTIQTLHAVEWLSDNGSAFTARETLNFAAAHGHSKDGTKGSRAPPASPRSIEP
jgi:transposase InsO family protein